MRFFSSTSTIICGITIVAAIAFYQHSFLSNSPTSHPAEQRFKPIESFFLQRSFPDDKFAIKAYTKAIKEEHESIQETVALRNNTDVAWQTEGPGNIGARVNTIAIHPNNDDIMIAGFSQGGAFKTTDAGNTWIPVFDNETFLSIGEIVFDPNNPDIVYLGTGDPNISGYPFIGDGMYKSIDGGDTWTNIGLEETRIISKIIVDPSNSDIIYVATMGLPFERNEDRGLYKTTDGGDTWTKILYLNSESGIIDMVIDFNNPETLYAAGWTRIRNNNESILNSNVARIYKTTDGGANWETLSGGLPQEELSRPGLAMSATNPNKIYVLHIGTNQDVQGVYLTLDAGTTWTSVPTLGLNNAVGGFGWYFGRIDVNPTNDDQLFLHGVSFWTGISGAWTTVNIGTHADKHDLAFTSTGDMILATDGGLYRSSDGGVSWNDIENIATTQLYRVAYNPHLPDIYYGGAQDNGSMGGNAEGINNWERIFGGDGFQMAFRPDNPDVVYAETQNGGLVVSQNGGASFSGATSGIPTSDRRHWDMQYIISEHNPDVLYTGTFRVYKSTAGAVPSWSAISPDLTDGTNNRFHLISTLDESPLNSELLYVGTNDGKVWRTDDGGANWIDISAGLPIRYVTDIKVSPTFEDYVYVTHSGYKDGDYLPRVHRSKDRGANWEDISSNLPNLALNDVFILPDYDDEVLFVASDGGVHASFDAGVTWERLGNNMPIIPVYDLEHNVANNELIAGTFARSIQTISLDAVLVDVLAANWLRFEAQQKEETVELVWEVQSDASTSHYEIQHATDGKIFQKIGQQESQHATIEKYRFSHRHPVKGENYYRIAEFDEQGKVSYSNIQQVDIDELTTAAIQLYPNPTTDKVVIDYQKITEQAVVQFWTMDGKLLMTKPMNDTQITYDVQHFPKGQYVVKVVDGDKVESLLLHKK